MSTSCYALYFQDRPTPYFSDQKKKIADPCLKIYLRLKGSGEEFPTHGNFHSLNQDSLDFYGITFTSLKDKKSLLFVVITLFYYLFYPFVCCCSAFYSCRSVFVCYYQWDQNMEESFKNRVAAAASKYCAKDQCFPNQSR